MESAEALVPENQVSPVVSIDLDCEATKAFTELSRSLVGTGRQFAIVVDGSIVTAPTMDSLIVDGQLQISGDFTLPQAQDLARRLQVAG